MNIVILSVYPFPNGFAATNRIISYSKGLVELGNNVLNLIVRPTEKKLKIKNHNFKGNFCGIEFLYTNNTTVWANSILLKFLQSIIGLLNSLLYLFILKKKRNLDIIIVSIDNILYTIMYSIYARVFLQRKVVFISDEYPFVLRNSNKIYRYFPKLLSLTQRIAYKFFDGIIVMTKALGEYFKKLYPEIPQQLVLMTVELERFEIKKSNKKNGKYLAFIGELQPGKDGLDILIKSFYLVSSKYPYLKLKIAGTTKNKSDIDKIYSLVNELGLNDRVIFLGELERTKVPEFLINSEMLLLARPNSERSKGGFPTKLGEYLATGNPVIVTRVGEIPEYLTDGKNAYLAEPDSVESFSSKLDEALSNLEKARLIGLAGKEVAEKIFNYKVQSKIMENFLKSLINR